MSELLQESMISDKIVYVRATARVWLVTRYCLFELLQENMISDKIVFVRATAREYD